MGYLTYMGANAGSPTTIDMKTPDRVVQQGPKVLAAFNAGKEVAPQSGCLACHKIGENGNGGPGPPLTHNRRAAAATGDRAHADQPDGADAVVREAAARRA